MALLLRAGQQADFEDIYTLYASALGEEDGVLVNLLRQGDTFIPQLSLVALVDDEISGHILFSKIEIVNDNGRRFGSLALAPMAVKPGLQKQGIGSKLVLTGLEIAREMGFESVIVLGHVAYYPKFGFVPTTKWNIKSPFKNEPEAFMGIELIENALAGVSGMVIYPKAFEVVGQAVTSANGK